jgi:hypothetical protein
LKVSSPDVFSSRSLGVQRDPLRIFRPPLDETLAPVKSSGGFLGEITWQAPLWPSSRRRPHFWLAKLCPREGPPNSSSGLVLCRGDAGGISEGVPPGPREGLEKQAQGLGTLKADLPPHKYLMLQTFRRVSGLGASTKNIDLRDLQGGLTIQLSRLTRKRARDNYLQGCRSLRVCVVLWFLHRAMSAIRDSVLE